MTIATAPVVALDVGGTGLKGAILDSDSTVLASFDHRTGAERGPDAVVETVLDVLAQLCAHPAATNAAAAGLVVPGVVDSTTGCAVWSENLHWRDVPLRDLAEKRVGLPVAVGHDVRAGGLAETSLGAARGYCHALIVPIGTGIAAAIVADGRIIEGDGLAGELGHVDVGHTEPCACGGTGCLEAIASASAIARRYSRRSGLPAEGAADVVARMRAGDPTAREVWDEATEALAYGLATACSLVAPEVVVIGGGLAGAGGDLMDALATRLARRLTFHRCPAIVPATLGDRAGCIGAGLLARALLAEGEVSR